LTEEYFKKFGIFTADAGELQKFWKQHVSIAYKQQREQKAQMAKAQSQFAIPSSGAVDNFGFDNFGGYSDLG